MKFTLAKASLTPKKRLTKNAIKQVLAGLKAASKRSSAFAGNKEIVASLEERLPHSRAEERVGVRFKPYKFANLWYSRI